MSSKNGAKRVTMSDIAKAVGCSQPTVSFVLNDNQSIQIAEETKERVIRVAKEMGYSRPLIKTLNSAKRTTQSRIFGFVLDSLSTSPEATVAISGIRQALEGTNSILLVVETGNDPQLEPETINTLIESGAEAIIYGCIFTRKTKLPDALRGQNIPVVLLNCYTDDEPNFSVVPSEINGGQSATQLLIEAGHTRIGTIMGEAFMEAAQDRLEGYRRALFSADIMYDSELVTAGDWSASAGYLGTQRLMQLSNPPTAIFCQNDRMAIGCYEYLKENGYKIPHDISVVGYDDEEISRHLYPALTTVVLPHRAMGHWAVEQILNHDEAASISRPTKLECKLVIRDSVAPPSNLHG